MITIHFSQCSQFSTYVDSDYTMEYIHPLIPLDSIGRLPMHIKMKYWLMLLTNLKDNSVYYTYDEHVLLIAQKLHREKKKQFAFVDTCECSGGFRIRTINLDDEGDIIDDTFHPFFTERLSLLR